MNADDRVIKDIAVAGTTPLGVAIDKVPQRGIIFKLMVAQTSGTLGGFSYTLYNKATACPPGANPVATEPEQLYRVAGPCVVAATKAAFESGDSYAYNGVHGLYIPYQCLDLRGAGTFVDTWNLYLRIEAVGGGAKTFGVALTVAATMPE